MGQLNEIEASNAVEIVYETRDITVCRVSMYEGRFLVIDYKNRFGKDVDTEIYNETHLEYVSIHKPEHKIIEQLVSDFMWDHYKSNK